MAPTPSAGPQPGPQPAPAPDAAGGPRRVLCGFLYSFQEDSYGAHWSLHEGDNLVGRAETNVKVEVPIAHGTTSTRHATIRCDAGEVIVTDMKSTNGTYHNGRRITADNPVKLRSGDKLRFGGYSVFVFYAPSRQ